MIIKTMDEKRYIDIGTSDNFIALYSTIRVRCESNFKEIGKALLFLEKGKCLNNEALETARQVNKIRDYLSQIEPVKMVYDYRKQDDVNPLLEKMSYVVTSCGNLFLTADGKDLLFEIVSILTYGHYLKTDIIIEGD